MSFAVPPVLTRAAVTLLMAALGACGGKSDDHRNSPQAEAVILPSDIYADACAADNPEAPAALRSGSPLQERMWLRAMLNERYLWRGELPVLDATAARYTGLDYETAMDRWFEDLVHPAGSQDKYSFRETTREATAASQGERVGVGIAASQVAGSPRRMWVLTVDAGSPAAAAGVQRGDEVVSVNGITLATATEAEMQTLGRLARTAAVGETVTWVLRRGEVTRELRLTNQVQHSPPVPLARVLPGGSSGPVGYLLFSEFTLPAEDALAAAMTQFQTSQVRDLVIDLRYNGGGLGYIAAQLAYMVTGPSTEGKLFNADRLNERRVGTSSELPFLPVSCHPGPDMIGCTDQRPLPSLSLSRVFVLTGPGTCSASELLINGLRGVDVEVIQVGQTTCGKPYGFEAVPHCGYTTHAIDRQTSNAKGFGDYADGFAPAAQGPAGLPGCVVPDDLTHALGDPAEGLLAAALHFRAEGQCPATATALSVRSASAQPEGADRPLLKPLRPSQALLLKSPSR
ncbi:S41 family peptidase [Roseateles amylovorans]|uniref:S41 family peptidase n=1 Tax=Roseateles amylovorans TaxID=2978473 RepID=A0ABY6B2G6_9BURK|nr:S41 family peptidase [Roseateles amylovorans]UXH78748.1 S41 family peptidase [Roseateles amylovorans]